jgi:putative tryptophan/tyrosine transport system substrate-binding protein
MLVTVDPFFTTRAAQLAGLANFHEIPTVYFRREFAMAGGLFSYGSNAHETYKIMGVYAARALNGEKVGDLPVQQSTKVELIINLTTAKALRLDVPPTILALADEVIE